MSLLGPSPSFSFHPARRLFVFTPFIPCVCASRHLLYYNFHHPSFCPTKDFPVHSWYICFSLTIPLGVGLFSYFLPSFLILIVVYPFPFLHHDTFRFVVTYSFYWLYIFLSSRHSFVHIKTYLPPHFSLLDIVITFLHYLSSSLRLHVYNGI